MSLLSIHTQNDINRYNYGHFINSLAMHKKMITERMVKEQLEYLSRITPEETLPMAEPRARQLNMTASTPTPTERWSARSRRVGPNTSKAEPYNQ